MRKEVFSASSVPIWMPIFLSLMLVLLTLFIFLSTFSESDPQKVRIFRENYRKNFILEGKGVTTRIAFTDTERSDPLNALLNRLKKEKLNLKLFSDYLQVAQIKALGVKQVERGISLIVALDEIFDRNGNLDQEAEDKLTSLSYLVRDLPYVVELNAFSSLNEPFNRAQLAAFVRLRQVYDFFVRREVHPLKIKIACRAGSVDKAFSLEIVFKEPWL